MVLSLTSLGLFSCSEKSTPVAGGSSQQVTGFKSEVSGSEVLDLLGGFSKEFRTPSDLNSKDSAGLALRDHEGKLNHLPLSTGWKANTVYKVVAYRPTDGEFVCSIFAGDSSSNHFSSSNFPKGIVGTSKSSSIAEHGDTLISFTTNNSRTMSKKVEGEYDLIFHVQKRKTP